MEFYYITVEFAIREHDFIINESGGAHGENDLGLLKSVLELIKNDSYYPDLESKLTHAFNDENKRSTIALGAYFLEINGPEYCIDKFIIEMENIAVHLADNRIDKTLLSEIMYSIINEDQFSEDLKLKIIESTSN